ncbi:hypothetical protein J2S50_004264 [Streptomyces sp. DSM 40167]|nr:hypothetical protein [Streptomyces sp. DSM 40167]
MRTEVRSSRVPFSAPKPSTLDAAMAAIQANFPSMTMNFVGVSRQGSVRITGVTLADLISQAPDLNDLHYLLVECRANGSSQPDLVQIEFGTPEGVARLQAFRGWFRRIQDWDVRVTAQSGSSQEAERLLASTLSVLRGHKISATRVLAMSLFPALSEVFGLIALIVIAVFRYDPGGRLFGLALVGILYWRLVFLIVPHRAYIHLRTRSTRMSRLLGWHPSPRAQALWTVAGGTAGLVALIVAVFAWLAPKS